MRISFPSPVALVAMLCLGLISFGCSHVSRSSSNNRVAVALTVNGTQQPTAEQWANVVAALKPELAARGLVLVNDLGDADRILRIDFTPSFVDPNGAGHAVFLGWRANPLRAITYASQPSNSLSYVNYSYGLSAYNTSAFGYDRYSDYGYGYAYHGGSYASSPGTSSSGSTTTTPPAKTDPTGKSRDDCPPGTTPPAHSGSGRWVGVDHHHSGDGDGHHRSGRPVPPAPTYPLSSGSSSTSYSSNSSGYSSGSSSSSYSSSSSSYSSGGSSYSSSGSSGSYSSSSSGGGSSSMGSSGTHESTAQKQN